MAAPGHKNGTWFETGLKKSKISNPKHTRKLHFFWSVYYYLMTENTNISALHDPLVLMYFKFYFYC